MGSKYSTHFLTYGAKKNIYQFDSKKVIFSYNELLYLNIWGIYNGISNWIIIKLVRQFMDVLRS